MPRPKGSKNKPKAPPPNGDGASTPEPKVKITPHDKAAAGANKTALTDDQKHALVAQSSRDYAKALEKKKAEDANFKNVCKIIKGDGVKLQEVKDYLDAETEEGQAKIKQRIEDAVTIARWRNFDVGHQFSLVDGLTPTMSFTQGKERGMAGDKCAPPSNANIDEWTRGWHEGQAILAQGITKAPDEDDADLRPPFLREGEQAGVDNEL